MPSRIYVGCAEIAYKKTVMLLAPTSVGAEKFHSKINPPFFFFEGGYF